MRRFFERPSGVSFDSRGRLSANDTAARRSLAIPAPSNRRTMLEARNQGIPLLQHAPKSKVQQSLLDLAGTLCGKSPQGPKKEKRGFFSFR